MIDRQMHRKMDVQAEVFATKGAIEQRGEKMV